MYLGGKKKTMGDIPKVKEALETIDNLSQQSRGNIYITGDVHGNFGRFSEVNFPELALSKQDFLIICGDFGGIWDANVSSEGEKQALDELDLKNITICFVDGNHENHDRLDTAFPVEEFHGGKAHKIRSSVWHLMRGQVYELNGVKVLAFGGAESHDKGFRKPSINWWERELPSEAEMEECRRNLAACDNKVDIIITHCCPTKLQEEVWGWRGCYRQNYLTDFLEWIHETVDYEKWFFAHYHTNRILNEGRDICVFDNIMKVDLQNFPFNLVNGAAGHSGEELAKAYAILPEEAYALIDELDSHVNHRMGKIRLLACDSFEAARVLKDEGETNISVLNMANYRKPGGSVLELGRGIAQEEVLCLKSTLLLSLLSGKASKYYAEGKKTGFIGVDGGIFSPHVVICKDESYKQYQETEQFTVSVISCGAPECSPISHRLEGYSEAQMVSVIRKRLLCIFAIGAKFGVENIVLGAFGCGAFSNDRRVVANCFRQLLECETLKYLFKNIVFAIPPGENYEVFHEVLKFLTEDSNVSTEK